MTHNNQQELGKTLWAIANNLRGAMMADDFRDYMLSFLFWKYLSDNYIKSAKKELGSEYPVETPYYDVSTEKQKISPSLCNNLNIKSIPLNKSLSALFGQAPQF